LKEVSDLERVLGRVSLGSATPRDLVAMLRSLNQVPEIREALTGLSSSMLQVLAENTDELPDIRSLIAKAINDDPPVNSPTAAPFVRDTPRTRRTQVSKHKRQTDHCRNETTERTRSGIGNLRIRFNGVFGYFIEVSKANAVRVPSDYETSNSRKRERFTTPELRCRKESPW
jgi:DNA mismatch repair protein MutS